MRPNTWSRHSAKLVILPSMQAMVRRVLQLALDGDYDVLIVDRMLPRRDGLSVIGALRTKSIETPVLILLLSVKSTTVSKDYAPVATTTWRSPTHFPSY